MPQNYRPNQPGPQRATGQLKRPPGTRTGPLQPTRATGQLKRPQPKPQMQGMDRPRMQEQPFTFEPEPAPEPIRRNPQKSQEPPRKGKKIPYKNLPRMPFKKKMPDYLIWTLLTVTTCIMGYLIYALDMLDIKLLAGIMGILILICFLFWLGIKCRKKKTWRRWVSRLSMAVFTGVFAFGSYTIYNGTSALSKMMNKESVTKVHLITRTGEAAPSSVEALAGKTAGYAVASDKTAVCYAMSELAAEQTGVVFRAYKDYKEMYDDLQANKLDSIIVPSTKEATLKEQIKGYGDTVKRLKEYTITSRIKNVKSTKLTDAQAEEPFVVYLSGIDSGDDPSIDGLSDVNILLFINQKNHEITTISVPRDTYVPNPAYQNGSDKLTHLGMNGVYNSIEGLEEFFGINIDYYAKINFYSLIEIVDAMGGIDVDVEIPFTEQDENRSFAYEDLITLEAGEQHLNGKQALAYARHRKTYPDGTAGRERAQQRIIKAMVKRLCTPDGLTKINAVMGVAEKYIATDIPLPIVQSMVKRQTADNPEWTIDSVTLSDIDIASLTTVSMPGMPLSCQLASETDIKKVYNTYLSLSGEGMPVAELNAKIKAYEDALTEAEEQGNFDYATNTYILPEDVDQTFMDNLELPNLSDYAITLEEQPYLSETQVYYGLSGYADYMEESTTSAKMRLIFPNLSQGYYDKVSTV